MMCKIGTVDPLLRKAREVAQLTAHDGGRALLVGGYVRDALLGLAPKDADMEVFGIESSVLLRLLRRLGKVNAVGESFRVYKLIWHEAVAGEKKRFELDIALPRRDRRVGRGHRGFEVQGDPAMTVEEAARRRDFTINAILCDPLTGELIDPFDGEADLQERVLRMVDAQHFGEDSLRVLRAVQMAARFRLEVEADTARVCRDTPLDDLPAERIWGEWEKLLLQASHPSAGLLIARDLKVLEKLWPELLSAMETRGSKLCSTLDRAVPEREKLSYPRNITLMLSVLGSFLGCRAMATSLERLRIFKMSSYDVRANTLRLIGERKRVADWYRRGETVEDKEFRFLSARVEPHMVYRLARARGQAEAAEWFRARMEELSVFSGPPEPLLLGRHLLEMGIQPGPLIGKITNQVWIKQLEGSVSTLHEARLAARELLEQTSS